MRIHVLSDIERVGDGPFGGGVYQPALVRILKESFPQAGPVGYQMPGQNPDGSFITQTALCVCDVPSIPGLLAAAQARGFAIDILPDATLDAALGSVDGRLRTRVEDALTRRGMTFPPVEGSYADFLNHIGRSLDQAFDVFNLEAQVH